MISIYQFGTFDVANFGDLLFPLLAQKRLSSLDAKIVAVSPIGAPPIWEDCVPSVGFDEIMNIADKPSGVLIGGGNILTLMPTTLPAYNRGSVPLLGYPDIWVGASYLASEKVPVCWNAPGVPGAFASEQHSFVRDCIDRSSYVSVRDEQSRKFLLEAHPDAIISVFPDPAWEISNLWTNNQLEESYEEAFSKRGQKRPRRSIAVHLNLRYLASASNQTIAGCLDKIAKKFKARIVLLAIGPCHQDDALARIIGGFMKTSPLIIDRPNSLKEITSCIAHSEAYIGSSMHGLITASSFCVPGICLTSGEKPKFQGLREQLNQEDMWSQSWETIPKQLLSLDLDQKKLQLRELRQRMLEKVDQHWKHILSCIKCNTQDLDKVVEKDARTCPGSIIPYLSYRADFATSQALRFYSDAIKTVQEDAKNAKAIAQEDANDAKAIAQEDAKYAKIIAQKDAEIARMKRYRRELYSVYMSRSWRYTYPLRKAGRLVKQILALLHKPFIRSAIKRVFFLLPAFIRNSKLIKNLEKRFKGEEVIG
jgi:polysaccharide pyruvyl transferase WcaK-like protein